MMIRFTSLAIGSTFFTLYTNRLYACRCFSFLNTGWGYTYTLFISIYCMLSPSCITLLTLISGTNVGLSISTGRSSGLTWPFFVVCPQALPPISSIMSTMNDIQRFTGAKVRLSERKCKFICDFPNVSTFDEVKVTNKREQKQNK